MRPYLLLIMLLVPSFLGANPLPAPAPLQQDSATTRTARIAFVDVDVVLQDSRAVWEALRVLDEEMERRERELLSNMREVRRLQQRLEQQGAVLTPQERRRREQEILDLMEKVDEEEYRFGRDVREKELTVVAPLRRYVLEIVGETARRERYDMVLNGDMVLYASPLVDLTPTVLEELDSRGEELRNLIQQTTGRRRGGIEPGEEVTDERE